MEQYPTSIPAVEVTAYPEHLSIYKYEIPINDEVKVLMPLGAKILSVQEQNGSIYAWALCIGIVPSIYAGREVRHTAMWVNES